MHDRLVGGNDQETGKQEWSEEAVDDGCPKESPHGIDVQKIKCDTCCRGDDDDAVERFRRLRFLIQTLFPT